MGRLVEQTISSFYNGVSRQPDIVRLPSQVEEGDDALFSVVTGGFEKRPASKVRTVIDTLDPNSGQWFVHPMYITDEERFHVFLNDAGDVHIYEAETGTVQTVNPYGAAVRNYISTPAGEKIEDRFVLVTVNAYTFIINKTKKVQLTAGPSVTVKGTVKKFEDLPVVKTTPKNGEIWVVRGSGEESTDRYYKFNAGTGTWALAYGPIGYAGDSLTDIGEFDTITGEVWAVSELPAAPPPAPVNGDVWRVTSPESREIGYYVRWDAALGKWIETADPTITNHFDLTTMPHAIVRDEDTGEFFVAQLDFKPRQVGDADTNPQPKFVGKAVTDMFFHKNRLAITAEEWTTLSQAGDFFNFWKEESTQSLDSDPIDRPATANKATRINFAVPFRKTVFLTGERTQFELSSDVYLTPKDAAIDLVTEYRASSKCRPVLMGSELYFASTSNDRSIIYEYFYDDQTISNQAADITKHVKDYILPEVRKMTTSSNDGMLWAFSSGRPSGIYVYANYWDGEQKVQSSWGFWDLKAEKIYSVEFMVSDLFVVLVRNGKFVVETISPVRETNEDLPFDPLLNGRIELFGSYDPETNETSWTLPYGQADQIQGVLGDHPMMPGKTLTLTVVDDTTVKMRGNLSAYKVYFGIPYRMRVKLSKLFLKNEDGSAIITGRLQLRHMTLYYDETGYFEVLKTAQARDTKRYVMSGRVLGSASNVINQVAIDKGSYRFPVNSRADTVDIEIVNDTAYPSVILSATWTGYFNEISRQDQ